MIAPSPTFFTAVRPKRTPSGSTVNGSWLRLTSGGQDGHAEVATLAEVLRQLVGVLGLDGQQRRHEVARVVGLEVAGLVREQRVRGRVRLVEAVAGEVRQQVEDLAGLLLRQLVLDGPVHEAIALRGHDLGVLLAHGLAQHVGFAHREAADVAGHAHDLFLVRDHPVRVAEDRLHLRHHVRDLLAPVATVHEAVDDAGAERPRPVQRVEGDQVVEA